jgi:two-component system, NtrC family, sensor kinase
MHLRLTTKFTLVTSAVLVFAMALFAYFSIQSLERICLDEAVKDIDNLSETILRTTFHQMLVDDRSRVYQAIEEVGSQKGVRKIRLINKDGEIRYSTDGKEIGTEVNKSGPACRMCHGEHPAAPLVAASSMSRSRRFVDSNGEEVMGLARGIYNQPNCSTAACHVHPAGLQLLGVLDVSVSLNEMHALIKDFQRQMIMYTLGLLLTLALCLAVVIRRFIHRPVRDLLNHTRRLAQGDLGGRIEPAAKDELGELEEAFNEMTSSLRRSQEEFRELASSLEDKVEERTCQIQDMQSHLVRSEKLASLGELVAGIAHEINNPLTGIMVFANLLLEDPRMHQELREDLEVIHSETQRCSGIVRRLLAFSRESAPQKSLESVNELLENTLHLVENQPSFQNIAFFREYDPNLPQILIDRNQISQVFMNLLLNAAQAMSDGGAMSIETQLTDDGVHIATRVRDSGCGISQDDLKRIFDPFFTTKEVGTGLGLSVSYGIVENHGGKIEAESSLGVGTVFTILLPLQAIEADH